MNLPDTKITDELYLDYAKTVETEVYRQFSKDEFEWYDKFEEIKKNFDSKEYKEFAKLAETNKYIPLMGIIKEIQVYDKETGKYVLLGTAVLSRRM